MERFIQAIMLDEVAKVRELLRSGIDPNQCEDSALVSPLHFAAQYNALSSAKLLIEAGADVNAETVDGMTPLEVARIHSYQAMVELLLFYQGFN